MRFIEIDHSVLFVHGVQEFLRIQSSLFCPSLPTPISPNMNKEYALN